MTQKEVDALIRHQIYLDRFGAGLARRVNEVARNRELLALVSSTSDLGKRIRRFLKADEKSQSALVAKEIKSMAVLEANFLQQLTKDFKISKLKQDQIKEILQAALIKPLAVTNNTPEDLYESAFTRKEQIATSLHSMNVNSIKTLEEVRQEMGFMFSQFATAMTVANRTYAFAVANETREEVYQRLDTVERVVISAVLDGRTTPYCMDIDGTIFPKGVGPRPPFHPRCRTVGVPVVEGQTDKEVAELLSYRPQVKPGDNYNKGDNDDLRANRSQIDKGKTRVKPSDRKAASSSNYANFLASQRSTSQGKAFIQDVLGVRKGNRFIRLVGQGANPDKLLNELLYDTRALDLDLSGLKKRAKA